LLVKMVWLAPPCKKNLMKLGLKILLQ